jgi:polyphosphate kinase 2 (PPK2 family)
MGKGAKKSKKSVEKAELTGKAARKAEKKRQKAAKARQDDAVQAVAWSHVLRVGPGFDLAEFDPASTPGFTGDRAAAEAVMAELQERTSDLQERLYAESKGGGSARVLLVIQGMDTSGKGGIMRHVVGAVDPQGVEITPFKAPTAQENAPPLPVADPASALPEPVIIGVFDRSHYEDVLIVRVHDLVPRSPSGPAATPRSTTSRPPSSRSGTTIVKVMLHISKDEQKARLTERLADEDKHWKFNPGDIDERAHWDDYMQAYQAALDKCSTDCRPVVCRAGRPQVVRPARRDESAAGTPRAMDPQWPAADFDVEAEKVRLALSP